MKPDFNKVVIGTWTLGGDFGHVKLSACRAQTVQLLTLYTFS